MKRVKRIERKIYSSDRRGVQYRINSNLFVIKCHVRESKINYISKLVKPYHIIMIIIIIKSVSKTLRKVSTWIKRS